MIDTTIIETNNDGRGLWLKQIHNQTEEICLEAVKQNGGALYFVKNQTEEMCIEAVKHDWRLVTHVRNQTEKVCQTAFMDFFSHEPKRSGNDFDRAITSIRDSALRERVRQAVLVR